MYSWIQHKAKQKQHLIPSNWHISCVTEQAVMTEYFLGVFFGESFSLDIFLFVTTRKCSYINDKKWFVGAYPKICNIWRITQIYLKYVKDTAKFE